MTTKPVTEEILDARVKLMDLRLTMENIRLRFPRHRVGDDPSAPEPVTIGPHGPERSLSP